MLRLLLLLVVLLLIVVVVGVFALQGKTSWKVGEVTQTPSAQFDNLPDYDFAPNYTDVLGYRIHYLDEGPRDGPVVLLMHGQPSWSYLYRHMITGLTARGYRVLAPDLVGFGKSDKPLKTSDYSYQMHLDTMTEFMRQMDVSGVTLFGQDWGGLIGLRMVPNAPDTYARVMISNTGLPAAGGLKGWLGYPLFRIAVWRAGDVQSLDVSDENFSFVNWVAFSRTTDKFDMTNLFQTATHRELSATELSGYAAPFIDETHLAGARAFPYLVPSQLRQNQRIMDEFWAKWDKPFLTAFGDSDPVTAGGERIWQKTVPGAQGQPHVIIEGGAHFIQEDQPEKLVELMDAFIKNSSS